MKATYFKSRPRNLSGYEQEIISVWGMSRRTVKFVSSLREITGSEWQLTDKETSKVASLIHELGFEKFASLTHERAQAQAAVVEDDGPVYMHGDWYPTREIANLSNL